MLCVNCCIQKEKTLELERSLADLKEQLSSVLSESNAKDGLLAKQKKVAEEAIAGYPFLLLLIPYRNLFI